MKSFFQIFFFLFSFTAFSQNYIQLGSDIDGEAQGDWSGYSVSLSSDGTILAIGAPLNDGNGNSSGHVRVYKYADNSWTQLGADINGEAAADYFGNSVSLSSDGTILATGAYYNDGNGNASGHVRVYKYANNSWTQIGNDIDGEASADQSGISVSLSSDGTKLAIGAMGNDGNGNNSGHVRVYEFKSESLSYSHWSNNEPNNIGGENYTMLIGSHWNDITNTDGGQAKIYLLETNQLINSLGGYTYLGQYLGHSYFKSNSTIGSWTAARDQAYKDGGYLVTITSEAEKDQVKSWYDNSTAFIGLYQDANDQNYSEPSGGWKWVEHWDQIGSDINGEAANDESGSSVSLSSDGTKLAIGAMDNDGNGSRSGHVRVYSYANNSWTQLGADINGEAADDQSGSSVSLSSDGTKLAIGARLNDVNGNNRGHVRVYSYANNSWTQLGNDIDGEAAADQSGYSVSLSSDGTILAIGAIHNDGNGSNSGHVRAFKWDGSNWLQRTPDINGEAADDQSGRSVSLSSDGTKLAIGAHTNDGNGGNSGHVRTFQYVESVTLSVNSSSIAEAAGASTVTATLSAVSGQTVTVTLAASGTATGAGTDYTLASSTITIPAGQTTGTTTVTAVHDVLDEANETVILDITGVTNGTENGTQQQTITITDDDNPPTVNLSISPSSIAEAAGASTVSAILSTVSGQSVTVTLAASGTATGAGTDYTLASSTITIPAGQTTGTTTVTAVQDALDEANETVILDITGVTNGLENGTQQQTITITDDDDPPSVLLSINTVNIAEAAGVGTVTATLSAVSGQTVTVTLAASGSATGAGTDYTLASSTITIPAGQTTGTTTVTAVQDLLDEANETVILDITGVTNGTENGTQQVTFTITDDDNPPAVNLSINPSSIAEATGISTVTATLSNPSSNTVTVTLSSVQGSVEQFSYTNWGNNEPNNTNLSEHYAMLINGRWNDIPNTITNTSYLYLLETNQLINSLQGYDYLGQHQGNSYFKSNSSIGSWTAARDQASQDGGYLVTITSQDEQGLINSWFAGGAFIGLYQDLNDVNYSEPSGGWKWVNNSGIFGTATGGGIDYILASSTITIPAGQTTGTTTVTAVQDLLDEGNETVILDILNVTNGTENGIQQQTITITDDDNPPSVNLSLSPSSIAEAAGASTVTATLSAASSKAVTVTLAASGTATGAGTDYTLASSTITIPAGQTTGMATVTAVQDVLVEGNETVVLDIASVTNGTENGIQQQTITIIDDDSQSVNVTLSVSPLSITEAAGASTVSAILSAVSDQAVTVVLAASGTATGGGTDYTLSSSTITIPAGQTTGMATVTAVQDVLVEGNETVVLDITDVVNGTENGTQQQIITIIDDDEPPLPSVSLSVSPSEISENGGISTIMATLSTNHDEMVTVNLSVTGTATGGSDYVLGSQSIIIPAGDTTGSTVVYAINDDIDESKVFQESFSWSNWRSGEPNNFGTGEDYAMMIDREWNDISVNDGGINKYFILEVNKNIEYLQSNDPNQSYDYLGQYEGHSYFKSTEKVSSWIEARDQAYDDGGYLVTINSSEESDFINSYPDLSSTHVFIGLYQDKNDLDYFEPSGGWKWVTSEVNYETVVVEITDVTNAIEKGFQKEIIKIFEVLDNFNDNNAPTIEDQNFSIKENSSIGAVVGVLVASDKDNDTLTFTITAGTGQGTFDLDNFGTIIVKDSTKLDFELNNSLNLNVKVSDGLADATADVVINITDVDENTITGLENSILQVENVFPIPAKKKLKVIIKDNVEIKKLEFIDFSGITTAPKNIKRKDNQLIMDVTNLSSGIYILNIVSENKSKKIRIVISR